MQTTTVSLILSLIGAGASACNCAHNEDAGRWKDDDRSPASRAITLINAGGGCYKASEQGNMCVSLTEANQAVKDCLSTEAANEQSKHGDWFLWTAITCNDGDARAQLSITL